MSNELNNFFNAIIAEELKIGHKHRCIMHLAILPIHGPIVLASQ